MTMARPHHRASSSASSSSISTASDNANAPPPPLPPRLGRSSSNPAAATATPLTPYHDVHNNAANAAGGGRSKHKRSRTDLSQHSPPPVHPSLLQPRVAVVLNVPPPWHPWLFALRLCSVLPALWWGLPCALQLLLRLLPGEDKILVVRPKRSCASGTCEDLGAGDDAVSFALTEAALATIWSFACGYLAFFFTDCLMSRWLIHYTPQATIVRLLTINAVNAYLTMIVLSWAGGFQDPRLLLPGWIGIATTLTISYHITHQKINIRKETSTSVNVFSIASYISMVTLLVHMYSFSPDYPPIPLVDRLERLWLQGYALMLQVKGSIERAEL